VVCSLKCFGNDLICGQLITVKAAKRLPGLQVKAGNASSVYLLHKQKAFQFPPKLCGNGGYVAGTPLGNESVKVK